MLGGIIIQMVTITIYVALASEFLVWYYTHNPVHQAVSELDEGKGMLDRKIQLMIFGLSPSRVCMFIRAAYRTIELLDGWSGWITTTESYFNVLEGGMIVIAMVAINIFHPGFLLSHVNAEKAEKKMDSFDSREDNAIPLLNVTNLKNEGSGIATIAQEA